MINMLFIASIIIIVAMFSSKLSQKVGIPSLLLFIGLGILFGSDGLFKIQLENYELVRNICSISLVFIIFYGGFETRWKTAKPIVIRAILLSSVGVFLTAGFVGLFCYYILNIKLLESFLIGAIISSTDAASVFSILKSKKLALKNNTAPLLEVESGSNDPSAYMLTIILLSLMDKPISVNAYIIMILIQFIVAIFISIILAFVTKYLIKYLNLESDNLSLILYVGIVLLVFSLSERLGGNGYLASYIYGIIVGNQKIRNKTLVTNFFDGLIALVQICVFFLLGLLAFPSQLPSIALIALLISLFLTFIARPITSFIILKPFKCSINQIALVSFAGIRGASSIIFAIIATVSTSQIDNDIFHIIFCIVLFSILFQGTLLPFVSRKLNMIDSQGDVFKTFSDYEEENDVQFIKLKINENHPWNNKKIMDIVLPVDILVVLVLRDSKVIVPKGETKVCSNDILIMAAPGFDDKTEIELKEITIDKNSKWLNKNISEIDISPFKLITIIKRNSRVIIPNGRTTVKEKDILVMLM
ncbi:MAG: potassium/proton antiporter [Sphaerochaetaceae bacterium]|nr:potassium/proton antiporter [Sphaerochaetaceae bacterium]